MKPRFPATAGGQVQFNVPKQLWTLSTVHSQIIIHEYSYSKIPHLASISCHLNSKAQNLRHWINSALSRPTCSDCAAVASIHPALLLCPRCEPMHLSCQNRPTPLFLVQTQRNINLEISSNLHTRIPSNQLPFESNNRAQFFRLHPLSQAHFIAKNRLQWLDGLCCAPHSSP